MKHKLLRSLVAVALVCVLLVSWSPIRAQAVTQDVIIGVAIDKVGFYAQAGALSTGAAAFCYVALALGIVWKAGQAIEALSDYMEWSGELETSIYYYPDGTWSYGVEVGFVDRVRAFLFDKGYVVDASQMVTTVPEGVAFGSYTARVPCVAYLYSYHYVISGTYNVVSDTYLISLISDEPYVVSTTTRETKTITDNGVKHYYRNMGHGVKKYSQAEFDEFMSQPSSFYHLGEYSSMSLQAVFDIYGWTGIAGNGDVSIGYVAPLTIPMNEAYPEWYVNSRPAVSPDTGEEVTVLPIPIVPSPDVQEFPDNQTQTEIWQGSIEAPPPGYGEDTDIGGDTQLGETPWEAFKKWISEGWKSIIQAIPTSDSIAEAVGNVIKPIFVPDADFISEKWNAIRSRFDFADSISSSGELILDVLNGIDPEPPVIYVDLGDAEGSYYLGGQVAFLDLRWYERYKPTGDAIISAFLWLVFVWRMFIKLPGIIGGLPGDFVMQGVTDLGLADRLPARKKEYENQRQENRRFFKK